MSSAIEESGGTLYKYSAMAKAVHWSVASVFLVEFILAISFSRFNPGKPFYLPLAYSLHMSVGMAGLLLGAVFVIRRLIVGYPGSYENTGTVSRGLTRMVHESLYVLAVVVPLTGWAILSVRVRPTQLFGPVDLPPIALLNALPGELKHLAHEFYFPIHRMLGYIGIGLVSLHAAAALYHHFYRRDGVLKRMLPQFSGRLPQPRLKELE